MRLEGQNILRKYMGFPSKYSQLCAPSRFYLVLSLLALVVCIFQNWANMHTGRYRLGSIVMAVPSVLLVLGIKLIGILFWAYVLNAICRDSRSSTISWLLVLAPFIGAFMVAALVVMNQK